MVTQQEAKDMRDAMRQLDIDEQAQAIVDFDVKIAVAQTWWDGIKPAQPTTRAEALTVFEFIKAELVTQRNNFLIEVNPTQKEIFHMRVNLLRKKLKQANEKFMEIKRNG